MKKIIVTIILAFIVVSCQITERMYLQENGSVKTEYEIDFTALLSTFLPEENIDSLRAIGEFPMDTIVNFKDIGGSPMLGGDSDEMPSEAEMEFYKAMDKTKIRLYVDESYSFMRSITEANSVSELNAYNQKVNGALEDLKAKEKEAATEVGQYYKPILYEYDGKNFERKLLAEKIDFENTEDSVLINMKDMMSFYRYTIEYHFPKKVKSATIDSIELSSDGKVLTRDIDFADLLENPEKYNFSVELE